jgi:tRNA-(MS[2]IO[6]A)-hydroxylase (MiaE)-like
LSMWARRLVGEGLSQALRVAAEHPALAMLLISDAAEESDIPGLFKRLTAAHTARMATVGLNN